MPPPLPQSPLLPRPQATEAGCVFGPPLEGHARVHAGWDFKQSKHWGWETEGGGGNVRSPPTGGHDCMIDRRSLLFESVPDKVPRAPSHLLPLPRDLPSVRAFAVAVATA